MSDTQRQAGTEQRCPQCQAMIPINFGYVTWCDQCGWNLQPQERQPRNIFESFYASMGQRFGRSLFDEVVKAKSLRPTMTLSKVLAFLLAAVVHGITVVSALLGIWLIIVGVSEGPKALLAIVLGLPLVLTAWALRPRVAKFPEDIAPRGQFPTLYQLVDRVAQTLGTSSVYGIVVAHQFGAAFSQVGWRRKKILYLGLPLLSILEDREKVALIAHELAHGVNGDPNRGFFIGTALDSLLKWHVLLVPDEQRGCSIVGALASIVASIFSGMARLGISALSHLLWRDSQRAEYLADYLATNVSGTNAMLSMLEKLQLENSFIQVVQSISLSWDKREQNMFAELQRQVAAMPQREVERIRRVEQLEASRLDATHPPTAYRIGFLKAHPVSGGKVVIAASESAQLERELATMQAKVQRKLLDEHKSGLYY